MAFVARGEVAIQALNQSGACTPTNSHNGDVACTGTVTIDLKRLMETGEPASNVELYPGDRITVQRAGVVYVVGAVNRPGGFPLRSSEEEMTVLKALALAEDTKSTAQKSKREEWTTRDCREFEERIDRSSPRPHHASQRYSLCSR